MTKWKSLAVVAVTVPATAYVVGETVIDGPATTRTTGTTGTTGTTTSRWSVPVLPR